MKTTELIEQLQKMVEVHGDLEVAMETDDIYDFSKLWSTIEAANAQEVVIDDTDLSNAKHVCPEHKEHRESYVVLKPGRYIASDRQSFYRFAKK